MGRQIVAEPQSRCGIFARLVPHGGYFYFILLQKRKDMEIMKKLLAIILALTLVLCVASCGKTDATGLWANATYTENTTIGQGAKTFTLDVTIEDKTVTFTVNTDADTVGAALIENGIIAGEDSAYGLYIKTVNGVLADYDVDQSYWSFYINGEYAMTGVDSTEITESATYSLVYTK